MSKEEEYKKPDAESRARIAELVKETMANLNTAKTYTKGKNNGYDKLN